MLFNSWQFIVFFLVVYTSYWVLRNVRYQNVLLLLASYYFYGAWDWRFCSLLLISTAVDYIAGLRIEGSDRPSVRRSFLILSVCTNLGILGVFKYFNFFASSLESLLLSVGVHVDPLTLHIVLPVGISFYTFQTMSYTIDIYRREMKPTRDLLSFAVFVSFFPQLVAGPVERAKTLLPQIERPRTLDQSRATTALWLVFWGFWKKIVVADNVGMIADRVFQDSAGTTALAAYVGVIAFAIQIYCDFSGYSDIARGTARLMGIELRLNFNLPYFALNPSDFWRRWHISLSTWLRDYLYISLGGNRNGSFNTYRNLMITMALGGLWHGAAWNYVWWGLYHGVLLAGHRGYCVLRGEAAGAASTLRKAVAGFTMFQFTLFGWLLFRSTRTYHDGIRVVDDSARQFLEMLTSYRNGLGLDASTLGMMGAVLFYSWPLILIQVLQFESDDRYAVLNYRRPAWIATVAVLTLSWLMWGAQIGTEFIYFQF